MNESDTRSTMELIARTWPSWKWTDEQQTEVTRRIRRLELEYPQAEAAIVSLSLCIKYRSISPAEVLEALKNATRTRASSGGAGGPKNRDRDGCSALGERPRQLAWLHDHELNHPKLAELRKHGTSLYVATRGLRGHPERPDDVRRAEIPPGGWTPEEAMWNGVCLLNVPGGEARHDHIQRM